MKEKIEKPFVGISWKRDKKHAIATILMISGGLLLFQAARLMNKSDAGSQIWIFAILGFALALGGGYLLEKSKTYKKTPMYKMSLSMKGKNDPKLTRNLIISEALIFLLFAGLLTVGVVLENKEIDKDIPYFDNYFGFAFFNIFSLFFYVMAYFGIVKKFYISADWLKYFLFIGLIVMFFQGHFNFALIVGAVIGIVAFFIFSPGKSKNIKNKEDQDRYAKKVGYLFLVLGLMVFLFFLNLDIWSTKTYGGGIFAVPALKSLGLMDVYDPFDGKYTNPIRTSLKSGETHTYTLNDLKYYVKVTQSGQAGINFAVNEKNFGLVQVGSSLKIPIGGEVFIEKVYYDDYYSKYQVIFWIGND